MPTDGITLDRLFRPTRPVMVAGQELKVRALSGPEQNERSFYAVQQSRLLKKIMADHESPQYQLRLGFLEDMEPDGLALYLSTRFELEARREVEKDNPAAYIPIPDEATEDEKREALDSREAAEARRQEKIAAEVKAKLDAFTDKTLKQDGELKPREALLALAEKQLVGNALAEEANMAYAYYGLYIAVQKPDGSRFFTSATEASELENRTVFYLHRQIEEVNGIDPLATSSNGPSSTDSPATST